jgi:hypothetical protein
VPSGLRLRGDDADAVALAALASASAGALQARYRVVRDDDGVVLCGDVFDSAVAHALRAAGHPLVEVDDAAWRAAPVVDGLLAAVPLSSRVLGAVDDDVVFMCDDDVSATRLCEQLVLLGRDDAVAGRVDDAGHPRTTVRLTAPPWWLLARVVDGCEPGVAAFVAVSSTASTSSTPAALYIAAGFTHPLGARLAAALGRSREIGLLGADGGLRRFAAPWGEAPILDAIRPELPPATPAVVVPATAGFTVQLRLAAASDQGEEPELFVVDGDQLARLQAFADGAPPDELDRVVLGRLADDSGRARFVVRELARPGAPRLGARLQSLLSSPGFVRMPGVEGLFLPAGRRLVPLLRERALRGLLGLLPDDEGRAAAAVLVDEDPDGLRVTSLAALEASPLSSLTSFVLTERRVVYDRLFEDTVLHFPGVQLARGARPTPERAPRARVVPTKTERPVPPRRPAPTPPTTTTRDEDVAPDTAALLAEEQDLQREVLAERIEEPGSWGRLAEVKAALRRDDVVETLATALFLGAPVPLKVAAAAVPEGGTLLDLVTLEQPSHLQAVRLCVDVLRLLRGRDDDGLRDDILQQATRALLRESLPVPRRLQWATLFAIAKHLHDPIGLTRAREAVLGALNTRGLSEVLDLPRFVRTSLAMAGLDAASASSQGQVRAELVALVERSLRRLVPEPESWSDGRGALLKVIFADGLARVGGGARPILAAIEEELPGHDTPVQVLLRLYAARVGFVLTRGDVDGSPAHDEAWRAEVRQQLAAVERPEDRRVAEWLIKRSAWLRHEGGPEAPAGLRPSLARVVDGAWRSFDEGAPVDVVGAIKDARLVPGTYDFEVAGGLERLLGLALRTGRDDVITGSARAAREAASSIRILAHRARLLGATLRAAATIGDAELVETCLDDVTGIANDPHVPGVRDLLAAIRPALQALRRVGASDAAHRLLQAFVPLTTTSGRETGPLSAALAEGWLQLGDGEAAAAMLDRALERVWAPRTPHIDRFEAGVAVVGALAHWPTDERARLVEQFVERLGLFTDTFTTGRYFPTHQILLAERIVDTLVDERTARSDALQGWLDEDEARVRRRVLQDWRALVG